MVFKCAAPGCKSGYAGSSKVEGVSFHKFPLNDPDLLAKWVRSIHREDFTPTEHSRICSLHFYQESFIIERQDIKLRRKRKHDRKLSKRRLRPDAVPSHLPNRPPFPRFKIRKTNASAEARQKKEAHFLSEKLAKFVEADKVRSIEELESKLLASVYPNDFHFMKRDDFFLIYMMDTRDCPTLTGSIKIFNDLNFTVWYRGLVVKKENYDHVLQKKVSSLSEIQNLMAVMKSWTDSPSKVPWVDFAISCLENFVTFRGATDGPETYKQIEFLMEQLKLGQMVKATRRYSLSLKILCFILNTRSSRLYRELRDHGSLCLPSERLLNSFSREIRRSLGLTNQS